MHSVVHACTKHHDVNVCTHACKASVAASQQRLTVCCYNYQNSSAFLKDLNLEGSKRLVHNFVQRQAQTV